MNNLPKIALGTWSWGSGMAGGDQIFGNHLTKEELKPVFDVAMRQGLNLWDSATVYAMGESENILGSFTREYPRQNVLISTKFTPQIASAADNAMEEMLNASLKRFDTDYIDIYWIHNPADVERWTPQLIPLLKSGKVRNVGVSNHNLAQIKRADEILGKEGFKISAVQNHFSLLYRSSEKAGIMEYCKENSITFFAYMVLEQGALSGKYDTTHPLPQGSARGETYNRLLPQLEALIAVMRSISESHNANIPQVAMAWAIAKGTLPIIGVTRSGHIDDASKAQHIELTADEMILLEKFAEKANVDTRGSWENPME